MNSTIPNARPLHSSSRCFRTASIRSHGEVFEDVLHETSGYHAADVYLSGDGVSAQTSGGEVILHRSPNYRTPGVYGKLKNKLVKMKSVHSIRAARWIDPREHGRVATDNTRRQRLQAGIWHEPQPAPTIEVENRHGQKVQRTPKWSDHEHARFAPVEQAQQEHLPAIRPPDDSPFTPPTRAAQAHLLAKIAAHNGPQPTGPKGECRLRAPEIERMEERRRLEHPPKPPISASERAAALEILTADIQIERPELVAVPDEVPFTIIHQMPDDYVTPETLAAIRASERSAWSR